MQERCSRYRCSPGTQCVFRAGEGFGCIPTGRRIRACGTPAQRVSTLCTLNYPRRTPVGYGVQCNFC